MEKLSIPQENYFHWATLHALSDTNRKPEFADFYKKEGWRELADIVFRKLSAFQGSLIKELVLTPEEREVCYTLFKSELDLLQSVYWANHKDVVYTFAEAWGILNKVIKVQPKFEYKKQ